MHHFQMGDSDEEELKQKEENQRMEKDVRNLFIGRIRREKKRLIQLLSSIIDPQTFLIHSLEQFSWTVGTENWRYCFF